MVAPILERYKARKLPVSTVERLISAITKLTQQFNFGLIVF